MSQESGKARKSNRITETASPSSMYDNPRCNKSSTTRNQPGFSMVLLSEQQG
jgi:hypothetical protein